MALGRIQDTTFVYRGPGERHRQALVHLLPRAAETHDALDVDADAMDLAFGQPISIFGFLVPYRPLASSRRAGQKKLSCGFAR